MPLNWSQVKAGLEPQRFTIRAASALLQKAKPDYSDGDRALKHAIENIRQINKLAALDDGGSVSRGLIRTGVLELS